MQLVWLWTFSPYQQRNTAHTWDEAAFKKLYTAFQCANSPADLDVVAWAKKFHDQAAAPGQQPPEHVCYLSTNILAWAAAMQLPEHAHTLQAAAAQLLALDGATLESNVIDALYMPPITPRLANQLQNPEAIEQQGSEIEVAPLQFRAHQISAELQLFKQTTSYQVNAECLHDVSGTTCSRLYACSNVIPILTEVLTTVWVIVCFLQHSSHHWTWICLCLQHVYTESTWQLVRFSCTCVPVAVKVAGYIGCNLHAFICT